MNANNVALPLSWIRVRITETLVVKEQKYIFQERLVSYSYIRIINKLQGNIGPFVLQKNVYSDWFVVSGHFYDLSKKQVCCILL